MLLQANQLSIMRQGQKILSDVSLTLGERDFLTVIGPNGAGKSTLLKCLLGIMKPDTGTVSRRQGLRTGYIPQRMMPEQTLPITVERFLTLRKKTDTISLRNVTEDVEIAGVLHKPLHVLSGGEMQRVLLARALLNKPDVLVLDEPAQSLDVTGQMQFFRLLNRIYREREVSILMVSHNLHLVMASTKQVLCLYHHVCCSGTPQAVAQDPEFTALFGDDMAALMAVYHHHHDHTHDKEGCEHA